MLPPALSRFLVPGTDPDIAESYAALAERALDAVWGFEDELAYLDVETTGFDPGRDRIIEVAVIVAKGPEVLDRFSTLVDPGRAIPRDTTMLTGIDDAAVAGAPPMDVVVAQVADVIGQRDVVAHNASFDREFIAAAAGRAGRRIPGTWLDSLQLARIALPRLRSHRLRDLAEAFDLPPASHRAADDTEALFRMWRIMLCGLDALPGEVVGEIAQLSLHTDWPLRRVLSHHAAGGARTRPGFDLKRLRTDATRAVASGVLHDAEGRDLTAPASADVLGEFAADGAVGRMYDGFETRDEQVRMAEAVLDAFGSSRHLAVEAGTGVGKSVAYLVPAARFAIDNCVGVGVATKTNSLMDQLVYGELPALSQALGGELRYVSLKGYEHYPCMRKFERVLVGVDEADEEDVAAIGGLLAWVAQSAWGDLDAVNIHWRGGHGGLKREISCSVEDCTHKRCRFYPNLCYLHGVRRRAATAHIVVTNHALLFRDTAAAGGILPPLRYWVVDEAHAAESEARKQMSITADQRALTSVLRALHAEGRGGAIDAVRTKARALALRHGEDDLAARLDRVVTAMRAEVTTATVIAGSFFDFLKDLAPRVSGYDREEMRVTDQMREEGGWGVAAGVGASLARRLENVVSLGRELLTMIEEAGEEAGDTRADLAGLLIRVADQSVALETVLDGADETFVYSIAVDRRPDALDGVVAASKLDVGEALAASFYPNVRSVVYTSATIAAGEDFGHFARCVGLDRLGEGAWHHVRLTSSYDFDRQMAVFVPTGLPEPRSAGYHEGLAVLLGDIHRAVGGSVLTLFTNRRDMRAVYDLVAEPLERDGLRVLIQERGVSAKRLRDEFIADERLSLFALKSFWEGFDAKGDTLRCVVVPKLPFGKMTDPLYEERQRRYRDAWELFYLPEAILELKQAAGRLIRSSTDEGCVILADSRLLGTKGYARRFLEALPVSDVEIVAPDVMLHRVRERFGR